MRFFERIFSPIGQNEFVDKYFNKVPLHIAGRSKTFDDLLTTEKFYQSLRNCDNVRAVFSGLRQASIAPDDAPQMFEAGATLCATGIDLAITELRQLADGLRDELGYLGPVTVNSYLSPIGSGFAQHFDPRIVTIVQIAGVKEWNFCPVPFEVNPTQRSYEERAAVDRLVQHASKHGSERHLLQAGDILCLPAGCIHWAKAVQPSLALNIAFDYLQSSIADYISNLIRKRLLDAVELRQSPILSFPDESLRLAREGATLAGKIVEEIIARPVVALRDDPDD